jgi:two-component system, sensor histidine kinase
MRGRHPIWTFVLIFALFHAGSLISLQTYYSNGVSDFYLPATISIILLNWFGLRYVVPMMFLNAVVTSHLWGNAAEHWPLWFVYAIPETIYPLISYLLFNKINQGKFWLPDITNMLKFMVAGILIPAIVESFSLQLLLIAFGTQQFHTFWNYVGSNLLGEFTATFFITVPLLYYGSPWIKNKISFPAPIARQIPDRTISRQERSHLGVVVLLLTIIVFLLDFPTYWYLYGLIPLYTSVRCGFGCVVITNLYILILIYVLPRILGSFGLNQIENYRETMHVFLGANFVFVFAAITGRIFDDLRIAKNLLIKKNQSLRVTIQHLQQANRELDQFVYSVSHDLTAPLKSIEGVINVSKYSKDQNEKEKYIGLISKSVKKLEYFIGEVLDYSKNKSKSDQIQHINIKEFCDEIISDLLHGFDGNNIAVEYKLDTPAVFQDTTRLKIVLTNVLHNAIRFQKTTQGHIPKITISLSHNKEHFTITIADNGEGIPEEVLPRIFDMFYRGNLRSSGSGLGLYNAKLAVEKMQGSIEITSKHSEGSSCRITLPNPQGQAA